MELMTILASPGLGNFSAVERSEFEFESHDLYVTSGIPSGWLVRAALFLMYINDVGSEIRLII